MNSDPTILITPEMEEILLVEYPQIQIKSNSYQQLKELNEEYFKKMKAFFEQSQLSWQSDYKSEAKKYSDLGKVYRILLKFTNDTLKEIKKNNFQEERLLNYLELKNFITSDPEFLKNDFKESYSQDSRKIASEFAQEMKTNYSLSQKFWEEGDKAAAKKYSELGDMSRKNMEHFHIAAAKTAYVQNNEKKKDNELDLHYLTVEEAQIILVESLERFQEKGEKVVNIIVGKGLHSGENGPKLRDLVINYAQLMNYEFKNDDKNFGCIILKLN